ncbi:MAG TPA: hypothetical protein VM866_02660 [Pyrinomonadaceae bacterium]|nr:hypothetical protein [Pyrinomonadaceae bacterium]
MKRVLPCIIAVVALGVFLAGVSKPWRAGVTESWEGANGGFKMRIERSAEIFSFSPGRAKFALKSVSDDFSSWKEITTFRHHDPDQVPSPQLHFMGGRVGFMFVGWKYAVTTDAGATWNVWDGQKDLPTWKCCDDGLIRDVVLRPDGTGSMRLRVTDVRPVDKAWLNTDDYGKHWAMTRWMGY